MSRSKTLFRKIITHSCQLPGMLIPIILVGWMSAVITGGGWIDMLVWIRLISITLLVCFGCGVLIKFIYYKDRPHPQKYKNRWQKIDASTFPSIHTARATIFMCMGWLLSYILYQQHGQHYTFSVLSLIIISLLYYILIARSRIVLKKHFFIDIVFGTVLGVVSVAFARVHIDAIMAGLQLISSR